VVYELVFCPQCGSDLPEESNFCLKCGIITAKGIEQGISYPWNWEKEMEKTLSTASREIEKAFKSVKNSIKKSIKKDAMICPHCEESNIPDSKFCYKCGKELNKA